MKLNTAAFLAAERARVGQSKGKRKRVEVWFRAAARRRRDEARFGQQGTLTTVWAPKGSSPTAVKQTEYESLYLYAAVNPLTGRSSAMLAPRVNTDYMNAHLRFISEEAGKGTHVVLVLDGAGWHKSGWLKVPENVTLLYLPPRSPELNPVERVWRHMRQRYTSNRAYADYDHLFEEVKAAWNRVDPATLASITATEWVRRAG